MNPAPCSRANQNRRRGPNASGWHGDEYDESRVDFSRWKGIYETWLRRKQAYDEQMKEETIAKALRFHPAY